MPTNMTRKIVFDPCFDSGAFPGPLAGRKAVVGESWVGPYGLLNILETALGLAGSTTAQAERAASLLPTMQTASGFWSESFAVDPFGTAEVLLHWRDALAIQGWKGEGGGRLDQLAKITSGVQAGFPDRLAAVVKALEDRDPGSMEIMRLLPVDDLPLLWQKAFESLKKSGVAITDLCVAESPAAGNLGAARKAGFSPYPADDSLQLLRTNGPLEAAERIAAHLAGMQDLAGTVVVGADSVLDAALRRYNLPTTGAPLGTGGNALLEILPLVLACGWTPADPMRVLELLSLPVGPVPHGISFRLVNALHTWPAVGSAEWATALADGLAAIGKDEDRDRLANRLKTIFAPAASHGKPYGLKAIQDRVGMLIPWMQGRKQMPDEKRPDLWEAAIAQCSVFKRLVECSGLSELPDPMIGRLLAKAGAEVSATYIYPAEAGLSHVEEPGCVTGPATQVIWWAFTKNSARPPERPFLTRVEMDALKAVGVLIPDPGRLELAAAERRRRPLRLATQRLILACPRRDYDGTELAPHPLWDEIAGSLKDGNQIHRLEVSDLRSETALKKVNRTKRIILQPLRDWKVKTRILGRDVESASGAGSLVGCPLAWVLKYACQLKSGTIASLPAGDTLWGTLVHHIIERVVALKPVNAKAAATAAGKVFDAEVPRLAASLYLPGGDSDRIMVRETAVKAVSRLWELVLTGTTTVVGSEKEYSGNGLGTKLNGPVDLVVDSPLRVVDFKWGGEKYREKSLSAGEAYQLALYGHLVAGGIQPACPGAYFILKNQSLITNDRTAFPKADVVVSGPSAEDTWQAFEKAYKACIGRVSAGVVTAEGIPSAEIEDAGMTETGSSGSMRLEAPCGFCEYGGICGQA